ncbi:uncharacterized protein LOC128228573 isoform X2 [Mya arenaria]|uniref:uncharacterized protein LOC128228573 isoform X2 n=1 Tax=Mya arenaria TaxID=6604 RepID=UPI0022E55F5F|nr:uncharacterized protein LOC128228573 isoform X2 [Mya arenaria]
MENTKGVGSSDALGVITMHTVPVVVFSLLLSLAAGKETFNLTQGPLPDEIKNFPDTANRFMAYLDPASKTTKTHCYWCAPGVLSDSSQNKKQSSQCNDHIKGRVLIEMLTPKERNQMKIPVCHVGEVPNCGPPPQDRKKESFHWYIDRGWSNADYSVYFSSALVCNYTQEIVAEYYCNITLQWQLLHYNPTKKCEQEPTIIPVEEKDNYVAHIIGGVVGVVLLVAVILIVACRFFRKRKMKSNSDDVELKVIMTQPTSPANPSVSKGSYISRTSSKSKSSIEEDSEIQEEEEPFLYKNEKSSNDTLINEINKEEQPVALKPSKPPVLKSSAVFGYRLNNIDKKDKEVNFKFQSLAKPVPPGGDIYVIVKGATGYVIRREDSGKTWNGPLIETASRACVMTSLGPDDSCRYIYTLTFADGKKIEGNFSVTVSDRQDTYGQEIGQSSASVHMTRAEVHPSGITRDYQPFTSSILDSNHDSALASRSEISQSGNPSYAKVGVSSNAGSSNMNAMSNERVNSRQLSNKSSSGYCSELVDLKSGDTLSVSSLISNEECNVTQPETFSDSNCNDKNDLGITENNIPDVPLREDGDGAVSSTECYAENENDEEHNTDPKLLISKDSDKKKMGGCSQTPSPATSESSRSCTWSPANRKPKIERDHINEGAQATAPNEQQKQEVSCGIKNQSKSIEREHSRTSSNNVTETGNNVIRKDTDLSTELKNLRQSYAVNGMDNQNGGDSLSHTQHVCIDVSTKDSSKDDMIVITEKYDSLDTDSLNSESNSYTVNES